MKGFCHCYCYFLRRNAGSKLRALQDSLPYIVAQFPYRGGLEGVIEEYPMGQYSISARAVTYGVEYVAKVMTPKDNFKEYGRDAIASFEN